MSASKTLFRGANGSFFPNCAAPSNAPLFPRLLVDKPIKKVVSVCMGWGGTTPIEYLREKAQETSPTLLSLSVKYYLLI